MPIYSKKILPTFFSVVLHPIFMPTFGVTIILFSGGYYSMFPNETKKALITTVFSFTVILPLLLFFIFRLVKSFSLKTLNFSNNKDRTIPLVISSIAYYFTYTFLKDYQSFHFINMFLLAATTLLVTALIINYKWKISLHTMGFGGILGLTLLLLFKFDADVYNYILSIIFLGGIAASSRLYLQEHTPAQIYAGFVLGMTTVVSYLIFA